MHAAICLALATAPHLPTRRGTNEDRPALVASRLMLTERAPRATVELTCNELAGCSVLFVVRSSNIAAFPELRELLTAAITRTSDGARSLIGLTRYDRKYKDKLVSTNWLEYHVEGHIHIFRESIFLSSWQPHERYRIELTRAWPGKEDIELSLTAKSF